jgi:hypothetical protein
MPMRIIVSDSSCLIDLRKASLLDVFLRLPYEMVIPTLEKVLGSGTEIEATGSSKLSSARRRFGKGAPGSGLFGILGHKKDGVAVFDFVSGTS